MKKFLAKWSLGILIFVMPVHAEVSASSAIPAPAVLPQKAFRVECLDGEAATKALLDESKSPWFALHDAAEVAALTQSPVSDRTQDIPAESRRRFAAAQVDFTETEKQTLGAICLRLCKSAGPDFALLTDRPWRFLKMRRGLASDFPHTRGDCIIFTETMLGQFVLFEHALAQQRADTRAEAERFWMQNIGNIFLHEQLHVVQRMNPERFATLYKKWGFEPIAPVSIPADAKTTAATNPDAPLHDLAWSDASGAKWVFGMRMRKRVPFSVLTQDITVQAWPLEIKGGKPAITGKPVAVSRVPGFAERFPVESHSCDHPNEISAYLIPAVLAVSAGEAPKPKPDSSLAAFIECLHGAK